MVPYALLLVLCSPILVQAKDGTRPSPSESSGRESNPESYSYTPTSPYLPSSTPTLAPHILFDQPQNSTTCMGTTVSWTFEGGASMPLTIQVTNAFATQALLQPGFIRAMVTYRTLATNVPSTASRLDWSTVDVPSGFYTAVAFATQQSTQLYAQSPTFFVASGDTWCLANSTAPSNTMSSHPATYSHGPHSSPSPTSGPKHLSTGALAGAIAGSIAGVLILVAAFSVPRWLRHHLPSRRNRNPREGGPYYLF